MVVVDGGSSDGTQTVVMGYAERLPLKLQEARGANISRGRNLAVKRSTGDVIASTDAGVRLEPDWLERLPRPLRGLASEELRSGSYAVAGFFQPDPQGAFELALGRHHPATGGRYPAGAFSAQQPLSGVDRGAWQCSGGYPDWLDYCEDLLFDFQLIECCGGFAWAPDAVAHFRPRPSLRSFFKQYYRYARGDGKADLWRKRHAIRYATYLLALPALLALSVLHSPLWLLALLAGVLAYAAARPAAADQWQGYAGRNGSGRCC